MNSSHAAPLNAPLEQTDEEDAPGLALPHEEPEQMDMDLAVYRVELQSPFKV